MKRTRLSPEARREQLLDAAKRSIALYGIQEFSIKKLACEVGVSEPLLFHYFSSRIELLQQLLEREFTRFVEAIESMLKYAKTFDDILEVFVSRDYDQYEDVHVMDVLLSQSDIAVVLEGRRDKYLEDRRRYLINLVASEFDVNRKKAAMITHMASRASLGAARIAHERKLGREEAIETALEFVSAGLESQRNRAK